MPSVAAIENKLLETLAALNVWAMIRSAGRQALPETIYYPACFVVFDGDEDAETVPRPKDDVDFKVIVQAQNLAGEELAAVDVYVLNDLVRAAIRGKVLGFTDIEPFACKYRRCTDCNEEDGMIEYTHLYRTRIYQPVVTE